MEQNQLYLIKSGQNSFVETEGEVTIGLSGGNIGFGTTAPEAFMHVTGNTQIDGDLTVKGNFTTVDSTTIQVDDKNIEIGVGATTDAAADGGGITLHGATNKTITWSDANDAWTSSEHVHTADGKHVATDQVRALDGDGLKLYDDGGNGIFVEDGGNVGVGTTNPTVALDVVGSGNFSASVSAGTSVDATTTMSAGTSLTTPLVKAAGAAGLNLQDDGGNGIFVEDGGNVGIGTSDPSVALDVVGSGNFSASVSAGTSVDATTTMSAGTSLTTPLVKAADGNGLNLQDDGGNGIFVEDGGNVGIGTSDPSATLDVVGSGNFSAGLYVNGNAVVTGDAGKWSDGVGANEIYYSAGNVGVGTSDPSSALDVVGVGNFSQGLFVGGNAVVTGSAGKWSDGVGTDEIYYSAANVGIGTSDPAASLDVGGLFQVGSNGTIGGVSPSSDHVIKWNGSKWISATSPGGGGAGSSEVPSAFTTNLLSSNGAIHQISFAETYDSIPSIATDLEVTEGPIIPYAISGLSTAGYYAVFTQDIPSDNNYKIHTTFGGKEVYWATGVASTAVVYDGGNVGIGTTDPSVALDVVGAGSFSTSVSAGTSVSATTTMSAGTSLTTPLVKAAGGAGLNLQDDGGNGIFIADGGDVGIGTTQVTSNFKSEIRGETYQLRLSNNPNNKSIRMGVNDPEISSEGASFVIRTLDAQPINFGTNSSNVLTINSSGNVGIGTTSPVYKFHIADTSTANLLIQRRTPGGQVDGITLNSIAGTGINNRTGDIALIMTSTAGDAQPAIRFSTTNGASSTKHAMHISNGKVGIGTANPDRELEIFGGALKFGTNTAGLNEFELFPTDEGSNGLGFYDRTNSAYRMLISNAGNVGIGDTTPTSKLEVAGASDNVYVASFRSYYVDPGSPSNKGIKVQCGQGNTGTAGTNIYLECFNGNGSTSQGGIRNSSATNAIEFFSGSDIRIKKNIKDTSIRGIDSIKALKLRSWDWNSLEEMKGVDIGIIADELEQVFPELVSRQELKGWEHCVAEGEEPLKTVPSESKITLTLVKAIQEQQSIIEDLKSRIETLEQ